MLSSLTKFILSSCVTIIPIALIGEVVTWQDAVGGGLIILGCLVNEMDLLGRLRGAWKARRDKRVHSA